MKFSKVALLMVVLCAVIPAYAKDKKKPVKKTAPKVQQPVVKQPVVKKPVVRQPVAKPPVTMPSVVAPAPKVSMESYIENRVAAVEQDLVRDIFPRKNTIERIVLEFKDEYPGPDKEADTALIYDAIMNNPEIKKMITLENATQVYKLLKETINDVWVKQDELIWSR